jgi:hypothetical protein
MTSQSLYEFFVEHNGEHGDIPQRAISAFERRMPDPPWRPRKKHLSGFQMVIEIGLLADVLSPIESANKRLTNAISAITRETHPTSSELAELHVGALLTKLGGAVRFPAPAPAKTPGVKTPDLICDCGTDGLIDIEVTRAETKDAHKVHLTTLDTLSEAIGVIDTANYAIFVAAPLEHNLLDQITAVLDSAPGDRVEVAGKWCVVVGHPNDADRFVGGPDFEAMAPRWWTAGPSFDAVTRRIGGEIAPVTHLCTKVPPASYLNPIRGKADRPQRTGDHPFVIAMDTSELLGAPAGLPAELEPNLPDWEHVSAILLQYPFFAILGDPRWRCLLVRNPHATIPLPTSCFDGLTAIQREVMVAEHKIQPF